MADAERSADDIAGRAYAIDDKTAINVVDGTVDVVSEATGSCLPAVRQQPNRATRLAA
jgi:dipeptidase E